MTPDDQPGYDAADVWVYAAEIFLKRLVQNGGIDQAKAEAVLGILMEQARSGDEEARRVVRETLWDMLVGEQQALRAWVRIMGAEPA